ncbi:mitochondrial ATP synthase epsilon chain-domain-containing protein [Cladochytrium replicatum]|nr:mitochondrial ATP synthase epsilon chain-domain-containing protein [Cladochytrium replicatum]
MTFWKDAGFSYLKYVQVASRALRSVLKDEAKIQALKREETVLKVSRWANGKQGELKFVDPKNQH